MLWRCWLGGRKGIQPVKNWVMGCWHGYLRWGADLHNAQQMPLPLTISCSSKPRLVLPSWFLPFWYLLTLVVPDKFQKSSKATVCVYMEFWEISHHTIIHIQKVQESRANAKVNARQHCVIRSHWNAGNAIWQTTMFHVVASQTREITRNSERIRFDLTAVQGHPRSSILVSIESPYVTSY